jgi:hypothetical protein
MQLVLVLPALLDSVGAGAAPVCAPAVAELLAWSGRASHNADGLDAEIASRYGIVRQADWPLASIRAASLGLATGTAYWLAADPVTFVVGRDEASFSGIVDDLESPDAAALVSTLNAHFSGDGIEFAAPRPDAIFARLSTAPRLVTHSPTVTPGRPLRSRLPEGPDAPKFRRWQSEIQMLLHEHPVNVERETKGRPPVNGVWFSGGGVLPPPPSHAPTIRTYADSGVAAALAAHRGAPARPLATGIAGELERPSDSELVVVALAPGVALAEIERAYAAPARDALARGRLRGVSILAQRAGDAVCWQARRPGLWRRIAGRARRHDAAAEIAAAIER